MNPYKFLCAYLVCKYLDASIYVLLAAEGFGGVARTLKAKSREKKKPMSAPDGESSFSFLVVVVNVVVVS